MAKSIENNVEIKNLKEMNVNLIIFLHNIAEILM